MVVTVHLMGEPAVRIETRTVPFAAFPRRSAAALVALLALQPGRRLHREQLMAALWPESAPEDAANALHKAAHFARRATGAPDCVVLRRDLVSLFPDREVAVDALAFEDAARRALAAGTRDAVGSALGLWGGELLPQHVYASWAAPARGRLELLHRQLLRRAGRWVELVELDPTDEQAHLGLAKQLLDDGDRAAALRRLDLLERVLRDELGIGPSPEAEAVRAAALGVASGAPPVRRPRDGPAALPRHAGLARQRLGFTRTADGVRLAYATSGAGPPLVKVANWLTHLDYDWASPVWSHWWQELSRDHLLVRYDERGCGLSERDVDPGSFTLDSWVEDLETVVDALGLDRFPLLGISQGGPIALTYAARHPDRVTRLVVYGTAPRSLWARSSEKERRELVALAQLVRVSWGSDSAGFRQVYDARFMPDGPLSAWQAFDELQRRSSSPENAYRLYRSFGYLDASAAAAHLRAPTLIVHARGDQVSALTEAEELHALLPGSRLVVLDSRNHVLRADEPAFAVFLHELREFLGVPARTRAARDAGVTSEVSGRVRPVR